MHWRCHQMVQWMLVAVGQALIPHKVLMHQRIHSLNFFVERPLLEEFEQGLGCVEDLFELQAMDVVTLCQEDFAHHLEDVVYHRGGILQPLHILVLDILNLVVPLFRNAAHFSSLFVDNEYHGGQGDG